MAGPGMLANPRTFREIVLADLYRGQRLVAAVHPDPIDPQFRIASSEGDWAIAIMLTDDMAERHRRLALIADFMAWKTAPCFTIASELYEPDCVYAMGISHRERYACFSRITRKPVLDFGAVEWADDQSITASDMIALLPRGARALSSDRLRELQTWFGAQGKFPAVNIDTGRIGA